MVQRLAPRSLSGAGRAARAVGLGAGRAAASRSPCPPYGARHHRGRAPGGPLPLRRPIGSSEQWLRTCPAEPVPGRFLTPAGLAGPVRPAGRRGPVGRRRGGRAGPGGVRARWRAPPPWRRRRPAGRGRRRLRRRLHAWKGGPDPAARAWAPRCPPGGARATAASARSASKGPRRPRRLGPPAAAGHRGGVGHQHLPRRPVPLAPLRPVARPAASARRPDRLDRPRRGHPSHRRRRRELHAGDLLRRAAIPSRLAASPRAGAELRHQVEARNHASTAGRVENHNPSVTRSTDDQRKQVDNPESRELLA
jgi:hypothetical protein